MVAEGEKVDIFGKRFSEDTEAIFKGEISPIIEKVDGNLG